MSHPPQWGPHGPPLAPPPGPPGPPGLQQVRYSQRGWVPAPPEAWQQQWPQQGLQHQQALQGGQWQGPWQGAMPPLEDVPTINPGVELLPVSTMLIVCYRRVT